MQCAVLSLFYAVLSFLLWIGILISSRIFWHTWITWQNLIHNKNLNTDMKAKVCWSVLRLPISYALVMLKTIEHAHSHTLQTERHTYGGSGRKCSIESATLLGEERAWVYMEHKLGGDMKWTQLGGFRVNVQDVQAVFAFYLINVTPSVFPVLPQPTHFPSPPMPLKVLSSV